MEVFRARVESESPLSPGGADRKAEKRQMQIAKADLTKNETIKLNKSQVALLIWSLAISQCALTTVGSRLAAARA
jgi:hypothetical protein